MEHQRETRVFRKFEERMMRSVLDLLVLSKLRDEEDPPTGYDIQAQLMREHELVPSSGTVYSLLYSLEREGLVQGTQDDHRRIYTITDIGREALRRTLSPDSRFTMLIRRISQRTTPTSEPTSGLPPSRRKRQI